MGKKTPTFGEAMQEQMLAVYDNEAAAAARPMTGEALRAAIDKWGVPYNRVAPWLGLSIDGLHKQIRGEREVSLQTRALFRRIDRWITNTADMDGRREATTRQQRLPSKAAGVDYARAAPTRTAIGDHGPD